MLFPVAAIAAAEQIQCSQTTRFSRGLVTRLGLPQVTGIYYQVQDCIVEQQILTYSITRLVSHDNRPTAYQPRTPPKLYLTAVDNNRNCEIPEFLKFPNKMSVQLLEVLAYLDVFRVDALLRVGHQRQALHLPLIVDMKRPQVRPLPFRVAGTEPRHRDNGTETMANDVLQCPPVSAVDIETLGVGGEELKASNLQRAHRDQLTQLHDKP